MGGVTSFYKHVFRSFSLPRAIWGPSAGAVPGFRLRGRYVNFVCNFPAYFFVWYEDTIKQRNKSLEDDMDAHISLTIWVRRLGRLLEMGTAFPRFICFYLQILFCFQGAILNISGHSSL